ncbi:recombinase family protein [Kutzneria sp. CA-103260]|uniref:recombinase family protein n=1 Tax=Kutzneria sp. CA-103260 TaxID=2802641 RepID=UPI001BA85D77|nr:recombinase family protein [Kutzneria sp. CA-103260]
MLVLEHETSVVVRRVFAEYLDGQGDRAIANGLNRDGILCRSARRPDQNRHRLADGWQGSTVRAILENPRYTGYAVFGRWTKQETLLDPDDVADGLAHYPPVCLSPAVCRDRSCAVPGGDGTTGSRPVCGDGREPGSPAKTHLGQVGRVVRTRPGRVLAGCRRRKCRPRRPTREPTMRLMRRVARSATAAGPALVSRV